MYYWNYNRLAFELGNHNLSEWQKSKYYLANLYLQMLATAVPAYLFGIGLSIFGMIAYCISALIAYLGMKSIYLACRNFKSVSVIDSVLIIGFPVAIRAQAVLWLVYFLLVSLYSRVNLPVIIFYAYELLSYPLYFFFYFYLIKASIERNYT